MIRGELNRQQLKQMRETLANADLPPRKRQRLLWRIAKLGIVAAAKRHQRQQAAPDGTPWEPRKPQADKPALPRQAKRLRALGYKTRKGKRWVKPSSKQIMETMSMAQAGLLIRKLKDTPSKRTWTIDIPGRVFLGVSNDEFNQIIARQMQAIGFGWDVTAQQIRG